MDQSLNIVEANLAIVPLAVIAFTTAAVFTDLKNRQIPNWLTVSSFVAALAFHLYSGGWSGLLQSLGGFATGFGLLLVLWLIGGGGGGDVKLMGAIGAWVGPVLTLIIFFASTICAVLCVLAVVTWRLVSTAPSKQKSVKRKSRSHAKTKLTPGADAMALKMQNAVPYAIPAAIASWGVVLLQFI